MEDREYTMQVVDIDIANATAAGIQSSNQVFNNGYDRLEGVALVEKTNGGNASEYEVGFDFSSENLTVRTVHHSLYQFDASCPSDARFQKLSAKASGSSFTINTKLREAASADLSYQLILRLSRPRKTEC